MFDHGCSEKQKEKITDADFQQVLQSFNNLDPIDVLKIKYNNISSLFDGDLAPASRQLDCICMFLDLIGTECSFD